MTLRDSQARIEKCRVGKGQDRQSDSVVCDRMRRQRLAAAGFGAIRFQRLLHVDKRAGRNEIRRA